MPRNFMSPDQPVTTRHLLHRNNRNRRVPERRRAAIAVNNELSVTNQISHGRILVQNPGESIIRVAFPVWYIEIPTFTFGGELSELTPAVPGNFPIISACVLKWRMRKPDKTDATLGARRYYRGAKLALMHFGPEDQEFWFHWSFVGMGIVNPVHTNNLLSEDIA